MAHKLQVIGVTGMSYSSGEDMVCRLRKNTEQLYKTEKETTEFSKDLSATPITYSLMGCTCYFKG